MAGLASWSDKDEKEEGGYTFIEVIVCMLMITLLVEAFTQTLISDAKIKYSVQKEEDSVLCVQRLLGDIKEQIKQEAEDTNINQFLIKIKRDSIWTLEQFFGTKDSILLQKKYNLEQYAYEIAIWDTGNMSAESKNFDISQNQLGSARYIVSDLECYDPVESLKEGTWPSLRAEGEMVSKLKEMNRQGVREQQEKEGVYLSRINVTDEEVIFNHISEGINLEWMKVKSEEGGSEGYTFNSSINQSDLEGISLIEVNLSEMSQNNNLKITFINDLDMDQIVCIQGEKPANIKIDMIDMGEGRSMILQEQLYGKSLFYIIMVIVREKKPEQGEEGKIVKRMIDLYSC